MEEKVIESISNISNIYSLIAIIVVSVLVFLYFVRESLFKLIKPKHIEKPISELVNHSIFYVIDGILSKVDRLKFYTYNEYDTKKTECMRFIIRTQLTTIKESIKKMLLDKESENLSEEDLASKVMTLNSMVVKWYNTEAKKVLTNSNGDYAITEDEANLLINAYTSYREEYHNDYNTQMISVIKSDTYPTNFIKVSALLEVVSTTLHPIPVYARGAMEEVNGAFMKYNE